MYKCNFIARSNAFSDFEPGKIFVLKCIFILYVIPRQYVYLYIMIYTTNATVPECDTPAGAVGDPRGAGGLGEIFLPHLIARKSPSDRHPKIHRDRGRDWGRHGANRGAERGA